MIEAKEAKGNHKPGKPGKWLTNAAYNAVLAYDEVVKAAEEKGTLKAPETGDIKKPVEIVSSEVIGGDKGPELISFTVKGTFQMAGLDQGAQNAKPGKKPAPAKRGKLG